MYYFCSDIFLRVYPPAPRRPERVFLREGSPETGMVPVFGDPSRKKTRSGRCGYPLLVRKITGKIGGLFGSTAGLNLISA
ncbi:hypothetical protein Lsha_2318 [Legionella shakespearei DSM 23087]|uniref:Uncharacterized protein n=1 Tax=Legionella shakespearei DSM 23087 TaxID=1122169 RepID=A0A0W0YKR0_9GAMM|nr:hypothetical protein Lsha_2318 [Legionella shakespearei DSM 23087]